MEFPLTPAVAKHTLVEEPADLYDTVMMGLRLTCEGINRSRFEQRFGQDFVAMFPDAVDRLVTLGLLETHSDRLRLSPGVCQQRRIVSVSASNNGVRGAGSYYVARYSSRPQLRLTAMTLPPRVGWRPQEGAASRQVRAGRNIWHVDAAAPLAIPAIGRRQAIGGSGSKPQSAGARRGWKRGAANKPRSRIAGASYSMPIPGSRRSHSFRKPHPWLTGSSRANVLMA